MRKNHHSIVLVLFLWLGTYQAGFSQLKAALVYQTDFGLKDGAVAAMKGVAFGVSPNLPQFDLTHEIPAFNIWEAAYRLQQTVAYWPAGTVFISVVDPGVGTKRRPVVAKTRTGQFIVTPDNGTLTLIGESIGIDSLRQIDETRNRLPGSEESFTFHGRDVFAYTGARLAAGLIQFSDIGDPAIDYVKIPYQKARLENHTIRGIIPILDIQYGNVWTNIPVSLMHEAGIKKGDSLEIIILHDKKKFYKGRMPYLNTFGDVAEGRPLAYINSLLQLSIGINMGSFAQKFKIGSGVNWEIIISY